MSYGEAAILGFVQGMTEFLPVSSSAHLKLVPWLAGWNYQGLAYDIALHWGTLLALAAFFWKDWLNLLAGAAGRGTEEDKGLFWRIFWATAPAGFAGLLLEDYAEAAFGLPARTAAALIVFGVLMGWADRSGAKTLGREGLTMRNCLFIGCAQALALIPGVSRSGITITTGLLLGLKREEAARFSFLLSTPIVFAAGALKLRDLAGTSFGGPFWVGIAVSALSGYAAIAFLLRFTARRSLQPFAVYRVLLGLACLGVLYLSGPKGL